MGTRPRVQLDRGVLRVRVPSYSLLLEAPRSSSPVKSLSFLIPINVGIIGSLGTRIQAVGASKVRRALTVRRYRTLPQSRFFQALLTYEARLFFRLQKVRQWPRFSLREWLS